MFNKNEFKTKLDFFIRLSYDLTSVNIVTPTDLFQFNATAMAILWKTKESNTAVSEIDYPELYQSFCTLLSIGLNQLDTKVAMLTQNCKDNAQFFVAFNIAAREKVNELSDEIEELLKHQ